jgi:hypothetical protein
LNLKFILGLALLSEKLLLQAIRRIEAGGSYVVLPPLQTPQAIFY